ncbi:ATP-binding protein [Nocardiopsis halotolerans]|uniref:ATP-binding protein n=1 Tax=Nocardiopsis halotolerans TaxID=124252 RepID=UPI000361CA53|nr:ATP-binding protein [Nocardiopsis halotolerans]
MADEPEPLPRRVVDSDARAPIVLGRVSRHHLGHALRVAGLPAQARVLRGRLAAVLPLPLRDTALVLTSELFTNAITHSRSGGAGGEVVVTVHRFPGRVQVKVIDQGPRGEGGSSPHLCPVDPEREGGRGLRLVDAEASRWGTVHDGPRTTVWFELDRPRARV